MRYTIWENTPLKWHKFMTYMILPISTLLGISMLVQRIADMNRAGWMWNQTITALNWLDIDYTVIRIILCVIAFLGCLPSRRKWYGPQCVIVLYVLGGLYSLLCVILYSYWETPQSLIVEQFSSLTVCIVAAILNWIYYRKRRPLFLPAVIKNEDLYTKIAKEIKAPAEPITERKEEPENSLELLMKIQEDEEKKRRSDEEKALNERVRRSVPLWAAIILGASLMTCLAVCISVSMNSANRISELQGKNEQLKQDYDRICEERDELQEKVTELNIEIETLSGENSMQMLRLHLLLNNVGYIVSGSDYYHAYDCDIFRNSDTYWAHNTEYCEYLGYSACPACH